MTPDQLALARRLLDVSRGSVTSAITDACRAAGVKHWSPHGLRRLAVDVRARSGQ